MIAKWVPLYWEPVHGTNERLMAGIVAFMNDEWVAHRLIRDDVLDALFGKQSANPKNLIDHGLRVATALVKEVGFDCLTNPTTLMGLHFGKHRETEIISTSDLFRQASLLCSSLANLDSFQELEESDAPSQEDTNKRFSTEVRDLVTKQEIELGGYFNKTAKLTQDGIPVKFGFLSNKAVFHFSVLNSLRQPHGVRDARARLWELSNAKEFASIPFAGLITGVTSLEDPSLGSKQKESLRNHIKEIEREADKWSMRFLPVNSASEAAEHVLEIAR